MSLRSIVLVLLLGIAALAFYAWSRNTAAPPAAPPTAGESGSMGSGTPPGDVMVEAGGDPGIEWNVPGRWTREEGSPMRLATYGIPAASGDAEGGRCAVYYFGPGQGGGTDANIQRWIGEFENPESPKRSTKSIRELQISTVRVRGTYMAHAGMGGGSETRPNHQLYGAIVEGPSGSVFFKFTGPAKTVDAAAGEFESMIGSLRKKS
jgi:hypothetical protein